MKNNIKLGLGILTVLATPFAVDAATGSSEAHAAQDNGKNVQVVKTTTQKQVESTTKVENTKVETTKKENVKVEDTKKENTANKEEATKKEETAKKDESSDKKASSVKTVSGKPQAPTPNAAEKKTGWTKAENTWYYYDAKGNQVKNAWVGSYWVGSDGKMVTNSWVDGGKYYVGSQGYWVKDAKKPADAQKTPEKKTGWTKTGNSWYYYDAQGNQIKNDWVGSYWIGSDGKMVTDRWVDGGKYYVGSQGWWVKDAVKKTGWTQTGNTWYLYDNEGNIVKNRWSGNYWLGSDGKMVTNSWVDGGKYYVGADGKWVSDALKPGENRKGWTKAGSTWYYFNDKGQQIKNAWVGDYWIGSDGKMVTNSWVDGGKYYVGADGKWVKGGATGNGSSALNNVLSIAQSYLGVEMGSAEHKKIVDAYNSVNPKPVGYTVKYSDDWCDVFVTTVFQQAGLSSLIGRECGVQRHIGIMQQKGIWQGKVLPKAGDVITFDWDGGGFADHIGIVESVKDGVVTTIEGNSSPYTSSGNTKVNRKTYNWNASYIKGYARPNY